MLFELHAAHIVGPGMMLVVVVVVDSVAVVNTVVVVETVEMNVSVSANCKSALTFCCGFQKRLCIAQWEDRIIADTTCSDRSY